LPWVQSLVLELYARTLDVVCTESTLTVTALDTTWQTCVKPASVAAASELNFLTFEVLIHLVSSHEVVDLLRYLSFGKLFVNLKFLVVAAVHKRFVLLKSTFLDSDLDIDDVLVDAMIGQTGPGVF
jgi:hypothetical protein